MNESVIAVKAALEACFTLQTGATEAWHEAEPALPGAVEGQGVEKLRNLALVQHMMNFKLWHVEDKARRTDVPDSVIADCKREVDRLNQKRNDAMERIDVCIHALLEPALPRNAAKRRNTETVGMVMDRLSILALKVYHMDEQTRRMDASAAHIAGCKEKLAVLRVQRADLITALLDLMDDYAAGRKIPSLYNQFKMYNDPDLNPELYAGDKKK